MSVVRIRERIAVCRTRAVVRLPFACALLFCIAPSRGFGGEATATAPRPEIVYADGRGLQAALDAAATHSIVLCDRNRPLTLSTPVTIRKPLTLRGLHARLPERLGNTPLVVVAADGVTICDFELYGNRDSVPQDDRCALLVIQAGDFTVERGLFVNSSKDGVMVDGPSVKDRDIVGGVVRDIVGRGNVRDVVSLGGGGVHGHRIRNVLVDNVRGYDSRLRGAVEVSDGSDNVTVRKVYAEQMIYAVDVQDHGAPRETNTNVVIEDVYALECRHAIRTANKPRGHANLTMRDITAERCEAPLAISNTRHVTLENVRIADHPARRPPVSIANCDGVTVRDVTVTNSAHQGPAILVENCNDTLIDGLTVRGEANALSSGVCFRAGNNKAFSSLFIHNVSAPNVTVAGVLLESAGKKATLTDYMITGNRALVVDRIRGRRARVADNLPLDGDAKAP